MASTEPHKMASTEPDKMASTEPHNMASTEPDKIASTEPHKMASTEPHKVVSTEAHKMEMEVQTASSVPKLSPQETRECSGGKVKRHRRKIKDFLMRPDIKGPRQQAAPKEEVYKVNTKWKNADRRQLLRALKKYPSDINMVYNSVPGKHPKEVESYVQYIKFKVVEDDGRQLKAPIESWLDFAEEMIHYEAEDHSKCLSRAMSIVSSYEDFPNPSHKFTPNYRAIYKYIADALNMQEPQKLSPLDSAILLDLMHGLADTLSSVDTTLQRRVMKWKYSMLNCKVDVNNLASSAAKTKLALTNVFPEELKVPPEMAGHPVIPQQKNTAKSKSSTATVTSSQPGTSGEKTNSQPGTSRETTLAGTSGETNKPQPSISGERTNSLSGTSGEIINPETGTSGQRTNSQPSTSGEPILGEVEKINSISQTEESIAEDPPRPKKRGRKPLKPKEEPLEKPKLFSLNPFCIPVGLLKLHPNKKRREK